MLYDLLITFISILEFEPDNAVSQSQQVLLFQQDVYIAFGGYIAKVCLNAPLLCIFLSVSVFCFCVYFDLCVCVFCL
jgi:hypothetical protein